MIAVARRITAEAIGTAFLLDAVVGSGIMGERLAGGNVAIALLANTLPARAADAFVTSSVGGRKGSCTDQFFCRQRRQEDGEPRMDEEKTGAPLYA
jgi:hypothetical protein